MTGELVGRTLRALGALLTIGWPTVAGAGIVLASVALLRTMREAS